MKEKLQNEVTKTKEKLENYLSKSNNIIRNNEKINKGIKSLKNSINGQNNTIKILSYVSKISKNNKEINNFLQELIKSRKISFEKDKNDINFKEYNLNGIQIPKNINCSDINLKSLKISWDLNEIDEIKMINNNEDKKFKYKIEIRKENDNDQIKFIKEYETTDNNYIIQNLNKNTNYEIRICCVYNNLISQWSQIKKVKTLNIDSIILRESKMENYFLQKIYEWSGYKDMELIYRGTRDGSDSNTFHNICDNKGPTICLFKNDKNNIFGGFSSISWTKVGGDHSALDSFVFTLTNIYGLEPIQFKLRDDKATALYHSIKEGPTFGRGEIGISKDFQTTISWSYFPDSYKDETGLGRTFFTGNKDKNNPNVWIREIEVFKLIFI